VEVAHIKAVSNFSEDSLISEINDISNLIGLCPNHHWEYDNGLLDISKYINHENNKK
jgi:predicted restriction endonuclease